MADKVTRGGAPDERWHDETDGTFSRGVAAHLRAWNSNTGTNDRIPVDQSSGALQVYVAGQAGGGSAVSIADGANVTQGAVADVAYVSGSGTIVAILKGIFGLLTSGSQKSKLVDTGGTNVASVSAGGALKVDASTVAVPVTDNSGSLTIDSPAIPTTAGSKTSAASLGVVLASDQAAIPVTIAAGSDSTEGNTSDAAVTTDTTGTVSGKLRGLVKWAFERMPAALGQTTKSGSLPVTIASDQQEIVGFGTDALYSGTTSLTPKWSTITASSSGAQSQVALVSNKKLRVVALSLTASAAVNVKFQSHVTPTDKTGLYYLAANGGFVLPFNPLGWFETISGEALDINLSGAVAVGGVLQYVEV